MVALWSTAQSSSSAPGLSFAEYPFNRLPHPQRALYARTNLCPKTAHERHFQYTEIFKTALYYLFLVFYS